jgi:hypothetical protein
MLEPLEKANLNHWISEGRKTPALLGPLERVKCNHWTSLGDLERGNLKHWTGNRSNFRCVVFLVI